MDGLEEESGLLDSDKPTVHHDPRLKNQQRQRRWGVPPVPGLGRLRRRQNNNAGGGNNKGRNGNDEEDEDQVADEIVDVHTPEGDSLLYSPENEDEEFQERTELPVHTVTGESSDDDDDDYGDETDSDDSDGNGEYNDNSRYEDTKEYNNDRRDEYWNHSSSNVNGNYASSSQPHTGRNRRNNIVRRALSLRPPGFRRRNNNQQQQRPNLGQRSYSDKPGGGKSLYRDNDGDGGGGGFRDDQDEYNEHEEWERSKRQISGRISGFGSTPEDFTSPRTMRQKISDFRERRVASGGLEDGFKPMQIGSADDSKRKWVKKVEGVVDAMVDAAIPAPELDGYMTSTSRSTRTVSNPTSQGAKSSPPDAEISFKRREFGDDHAYILYLEDQLMHADLEITSYKTRMKELEDLIRQLQGLYGDVVGDEEYSSADSTDSSQNQKGGSEIEWETGVPEEGILIDVENRDNKGDSGHIDVENDGTENDVDVNSKSTKNSTVDDVVGEVDYQSDYDRAEENTTDGDYTSSSDESASHDDDDDDDDESVEEKEDEEEKELIDFTEQEEVQLIDFGQEEIVKEQTLIQVDDGANKKEDSLIDMDGEINSVITNEQDILVPEVVDEDVKEETLIQVDEERNENEDSLIGMDGEMNSVITNGQNKVFPEEVDEDVNGEENGSLLEVVGDDMNSDNNMAETDKEDVSSHEQFDQVAKQCTDAGISHSAAVDLPNEEELSTN